MLNIFVSTVFKEEKMSSFSHVRKVVAALMLVLILVVTPACASSVATRDSEATRSTEVTHSADYGRLARGDSATGQNFGNWVVETSQGLIKDAYVRDNNKLGIVISSQVRPNEVKNLSKSLTQGFSKNFPNQDLTVLMYAPDKKLILTTRYDAQSRQVEYNQPG
jgi:hypothetical protein